MVNKALCLKTSSATLSKALELLKSDSVIAVPTDTLYGVCCLAQSSVAVKRLYQIKGRNESKPVAICVSQPREVNKWAKVTIGEDLLRELLPGPVTLVFERTAELNPELNSTTKLVGVRIPDSWFIQQLTQACREPLALTSANVSGAQSTLAVEEFSEIWDHLGAVFDNGRIPDGPLARLGSTVVDLSCSGRYRIIRPGCALSNTETLLRKYGLAEETC